jgi:hypothetical protein
MQTSIRVLTLIIALLVFPFAARSTHAQGPADEATADGPASAEGANVEDPEQQAAEEA